MFRTQMRSVSMGGLRAGVCVGGSVSSGKNKDMAASLRKLIQNEHNKGASETRMTKTPLMLPRPIIAQMFDIGCEADELKPLARPRLS